MCLRVFVCVYVFPPDGYIIILSMRSDQKSEVSNRLMGFRVSEAAEKKATTFLCLMGL